MTAFSKSRRLRDRRGGTTVLEVAVVLPVFEMETQLMAAFQQIAAKVPPAKLIYDDSFE